MFQQQKGRNKGGRKEKSEEDGEKRIKIQKRANNL
jgi:hypothetical protein